MTKLTDTQLVVLSAASNRDDGSILPLPPNLKGGAATKVVDGLIRRGLAERLESDRSADQDRVRITRAGLEAIGVAPEDEGPAQAEEAPSDEDKPRRKSSAAEQPTARRGRQGTKQALLIDMLQRPEGATVEEIAAETNWQKHTVRGAMAGALKKKLGLTIQSEKDETRGRVYRIVEPA